MSGERLTLQIGEPETHNEHLSGDQAFTIQRLSLVGPQENAAATVDLYPSSDGGYYSAYWPSNLTEDELAYKVEECLTHYEKTYPDGVKITGGKAADPAGRDLNVDSVYKVGTIVLSNIGGESAREELPLQRPINWQQFVDAAQGNKVTFARINTPVGDFCIHPSSRTGDNFGVMSHIVEPDGFVDMLAESADRDVTQEEAENLFSQALFNLQS